MHFSNLCQKYTYIEGEFSTMLRNDAPFWWLHENLQGSNSVSANHYCIEIGTRDQCQSDFSEFLGFLTHLHVFGV